MRTVNIWLRRTPTRVTRATIEEGRGRGREESGGEGELSQFWGASTTQSSSIETRWHELAEKHYYGADGEQGGRGRRRGRWRRKRWWRKRRSVVIKQKEKPMGPEPTGGEPGRGQRVTSELESDSRALGLTAQGTRAEATPVRASREGPCVESRGQVSGASAPPGPCPRPLGRARSGRLGSWLWSSCAMGAAEQM